MVKYSLGLDFGTESVRALLVNLETGEEVSSSVYNYPDGVIDEKLPRSDVTLGHDWALQNPQDYISGIKAIIPEALKIANISADQVVGIGVDFTSCTILPVKKDGTPLCQLDKFKDNPNAWVKLWKHHSAQPEADKINALATERKESFMPLYGGKTSSEWFFAKAWQILDEAPEVYSDADRILEAADWLVWQLTGNETRNACCAGYKALWNKKDGYPSKVFLKTLDPKLENLVDEKMAKEVLPIGSIAGYLTDFMASQVGLNAGIPVAVGVIDAHVSVPAVGVTEPGKMVMIMGTSTCHMLLSKEQVVVEGMCGVVSDGILPGYYGYEAGQCAVGDIFAWFIDNCVPESYMRKAKDREISIHQLLEELASAQKPGENGLLALDWWAGNRSVLVDASLTGIMLGYTLGTKPEDIYRALIESTAFGTRIIIEAFENKGVKIDELYACGGLPERNKMLTQIYADVTGRTLKLGGSPQACALGSAMWGAVAAGKAKGGFDSIADAAKVLAKVKKETYSPNMENKIIYDKLFAEYKKLHDYFGRGENNVLKFLKAFKRGE